MKFRASHKASIWVIALVVFLAAGGIYYAQTQQFVDSNVVVVKTQSEAVTVPYNLSCLPLSGSEISVSWSGNISVKHTVALYASQSQTLGSDIHDDAGASGSFIQTGLSAGTTMYYTLRTVYESGAPVDSNQVSCQTFSAAAGDTPSNIGVFARDDAMMFLNWKDNVSSTVPYNFEVQRIKITPNAPTNLNVSSASSQKVSLTWGDNTTSTPFYSVVERSVSGSQAFTVVSPLVDQTDPRSSPKTNFSFDDTKDLQGGTSYDYRVKACSSIPVGRYYTVAANSNAYLNSDKPNVACSDYSSVKSAAVAQVGLGGRITGYIGDVLDDIFGNSSTKLAEGQTGINLNDYFSQTSFTSPSSKPYYSDGGLSANSVYLYRARASYTDGSGNKSGWSAMGAGRTLINASGGLGTGAYVCTANGFCDRTIQGVISSNPSEKSEIQCRVNADCRNVGRTSRTFEEQ